MFDEGIWSADDNLRIITAGHRFTENGPDAIKLATLAGDPLQFDPAARLRPAEEFLRRHRQHDWSPVTNAFRRWAHSRRTAISGRW